MREICATLVVCFCGSVAVGADAQVELEPEGLPQVQDPMLQPAKQPSRVIHSWGTALQMLRNRSVAVAVAHAQIAKAKGQKRQSLASSLPALTANAQVAQQLLDNPGGRIVGGVPLSGSSDPTWGASISLNQRIFDLQAWHRTATAELVVKVTSVEEREVERRAVVQLVNSLVDVLTAERLSEVVRVSLRSILSNLKLTRQRYELGAASEVDLLRSQKEVHVGRAEVLQVDESLFSARDTLGLSLGDISGWGLGKELQANELIDAVGTVCEPLLETNVRTDVVAAQARVEIEKRNADNNLFAHVPWAELSSSFNYFQPSGDQRPTQWQIGALLNVPLYDGGRNMARHATAIAELEIARQNLGEASRQAARESLQGARRLRLAQAQFSVSRQAQETSQRAARLATIAFVDGSGTSFELVEATRQKRLAEINVAIQEFGLIRSRLLALLFQANCRL